MVVAAVGSVAGSSCWRALEGAVWASPSFCDKGVQKAAVAQPVLSELPDVLPELVFFVPEAFRTLRG